MLLRVSHSVTLTLRVSRPATLRVSRPVTHALQGSLCGLMLQGIISWEEANGRGGEVCARRSRGSVRVCVLGGGVKSMCGGVWVRPVEK